MSGGPSSLLLSSTRVTDWTEPTGLEAPIAATVGRRPSLNAAPRRVTPSEKVEVLSTESEFELPFVRAHAPPWKPEPRSLSRRPFTEVICGHCSRERRLFFQLRGASP